MARAEALAGVIDRCGLRAVLSHLPAWRGVLVLAYHRIGSRADGAQHLDLWSATQEQFDGQLRYLARSAQVVSGDELPAALAERRGRHVALTFDDGYRDNYERAYPVLRAHGLPATFFLATGLLDHPRPAWWDEIAWMVQASERGGVQCGEWLAASVRFGSDRERVDAVRCLVERYWTLPEQHTESYLDWLGSACATGRADPAAASSTWMTWEMVREMRRGGMTFGAHSVDHPILSRCSTERQAREVGGSVARVREQLGEPATLFAYPIGGRDSFDERTRSCLRDAGVTHAFSLYGGHRRPGSGDPLDIPRVNVAPTASPARFRARVVLPGLLGRAARPIDAIAPEAPEPSGWGGAVRRGVVWSVAAFVVSKALSFVSILVLATLLAPHQFGVVAAVAAYIALIELGSDLGMKPAVVYEQEAGISERVQTAFTMNLITAVALSALGVALAPLVADFFGVSDQADLFRLGALSLLLTGLGNIHDGLLLRDMSFGRRIRPQIVRDVIRVSVSVALAFAGLGAAALVIGYLSGTLVWTAMQWTLTPLRPQLVFDSAIARSMLVYGAPAALLEVVSTIAARSDVLAIGHLIDSRALGIYTIAYRLPEVLLASVAYTLGVVAFPALARRRVQDPGELGSATLQLLRYQALYALPVAAGMAVLSVPIIDLLFRAQWHEAARVLVPVVLAAATTTVVYPLGDLLKAVGKQRRLVIMNLVQIPLVVVACVLAAPAGIVAVGWSLVAANTLFTAMLCWTVARELRLGLGVFARTCAPSVAAATGVLAGSGAVRLGWPSISIPALVVASVAGAIGGLLALRVLSPQTFADVARQARGLPLRRRPRLATP